VEGEGEGEVGSEKEVRETKTRERRKKSVDRWEGGSHDGESILTRHAGNETRHDS